MPNIKLFILDSIKEIKNKVSWPSFMYSQKNTVLVLSVTVLLALVIGVLDVCFKKGINFLYNG